MIKIKYKFRTITYLLPHIKSCSNTKIKKYNNFPCQYSTSTLQNAKLTANEFNFENLEEQSIFLKGYFKSVKNQRDFMENLFIKFELKTMNDWTQIEISKIIQNGGVNLIKEYKKDMKLLFSSLYPNFPWDFSSNILNIQKINFESIKFKSIKEEIKIQKNQNLSVIVKEKHRKRMDEIFQKLELKSHDDWFNINITKNGGKKLLYRYYKGDLFLLLTTIYPDYSFTLPIIKIQSNEELIIKQREIMDQLFIKLNLNSIEDWLNIPRGKIIKNGGRNLLNYYKGDFSLLLQSIYPYYPINNFKLLLKFKSHHYFTSIENQREFMDYLFKKFKFKSFDDWVKLSREKLKEERGGFSLLSQYNNNNNNNNNNNMKNILTTIYPNYPWEKLFFRQNKFLSREEQINCLEKIYDRLKLNSFDDWLQISKEKFIQNGGKYLKINSKKKKAMKNLLSNLYPNFPWDFSSYKFNSYEKLKLIDKRKKKMDEIFKKLNLKSLDDWFNIPKNLITFNGGKFLYEEFNGDLLKLLRNIYPNFPFILPKNNFENILFNQRKFMDNLFIKFNLISLDEWLLIPIKKILLNGGNNLIITEYKKDMKKLFTSLYPNFPWDFSLYQIKNFKLENHQKFMDNLFIKFKLNSLDDWINITQKMIIKNKGRNLLLRYKNNIKFLLSSIYPNYPWNSSVFNFHYHLSIKMKEWINEYSIHQKKDWYRLPNEFSVMGKKYFLLNTLSLFFPSEKWKKSIFLSRNKKTTQRLLFSFTQMIYPSLLIFENYFHPKLIHSNNYELDIFIPALQLALEYQGEHHYDDLPAAFGTIELLQFRDEEKEKLARDHSIKIIYIPYWWDQSLSSLQSSLQS